MMTLTSFERQALEAMAPLFGSRSGAFGKQLSSVSVVSRENTGVGFYTDVTVHRDRFASLEFAQESAHFDVAGVEGGVSVILWGDAEGFLHRIEGVTFGESQLANVDLNALQFLGLDRPS